MGACASPGILGMLCLGSLFILWEIPPCPAVSSLCVKALGGLSVWLCHHLFLMFTYFIVAFDLCCYLTFVLLNYFFKFNFVL